MKALSIILILLFAAVLSIIEIPKMLKNKLHNELMLFIVFLISGTAAGIMISNDVKISNPSDWAAFIFSPFLGLIQYIMK